MADPSFALQVAIFDRLKAEVSCPIYDSVPMNADMPYVSLDSEVSSNADPLASRRDLRLFYLSVWSDFRGQEEVKRLMGEIDAALHERPMPLDTGRVISIRVERKQSTRDADGVTYQGSVTLRILTEH
ncbi:DUF3168 domain-containing protein [Pseudomonas sp. NPDC090202]|uniref:DUF3168 domain-containing protein n=1 Tax=Pseudomonas sp. NPDC090202 TaxID=3364476 RepID=UPI0038108A87